MRIQTCFLLALLTVVMIAAWTEKDDKIMGNYQGGFTTPEWSSRHIRAQVAATSGSAIAWCFYR